MQHGGAMAHFGLNGNAIYMFGGGISVGIKETIKNKGYTLEELADRWGLKIRQLYNIQREPSQRDIDAVNGLPKKKQTKIERQR